MLGPPDSIGHALANWYDYGGQHAKVSKKEALNKPLVLHRISA